MTPEEMRQKARRWRQLARGQNDDVQKALIDAAEHLEAQADALERRDMDAEP